MSLKVFLAQKINETKHSHEKNVKKDTHELLLRKVVRVRVRVRALTSHVASLLLFLCLQE